MDKAKKAEYSKQLLEACANRSGAERSFLTFLEGLRLWRRRKRASQLLNVASVP